MAKALIVQQGEMIDWKADADHSAGDVIQLRDGRAAVVSVGCLSGAVVGVYVEGVFRVTKTATMVMLIGSQLYWDYSADAAHLLHGADRDFQLGTCQNDALSADTTVLVDLNEEPEYTISLDDGFASLPISTAGFTHIFGTGEGVNLILDLTAEAQKLDALSLRGMAPAAIPIVDALICVNVNGDANNFTCDVGLANGTHATSGDSITEHLFVHIDGNATKINLQSKDGTTTVAATDTTKTFTAGTPFLVQFDCRILSDVQVYVNGVNVLPNTVFDLSHAAGPLKVLAWAAKTADDSPGNISVMQLGARPAKI